MTVQGERMQLGTRTKIGMWLFTILSAGFFVVDTRGAYFHWLREGWPDHAMFHAVTGLFYTQIICIMIMVVTWIPLRQRQPWSWWAIALMGIGIHGGHVLGNALTNEGLSGAQAAQGPGTIFFAGTVSALVLYCLGLYLVRPHVAAA